MSNVMDIKKLYSGYGKEHILKGIDIGIEEGELVGIIGPNGSGKTTLLRTMTGILKTGKGSVFIQDNKLSSFTAKEVARKIAVVTQNIEPVMITVAEYVLMGRLPYYGKFQFFEKKQDLELSEKYMKLTDVFPFKDKLMSEISGGERQRAQVARALVQQPLILLLDEPTSHLDITHQVKILDLVKKLNRDLNLTVVMVIHDLNMAAEYCSKLVMLKQGRVFTENSPDQVLTYKNIEDVYETLVIVEKNPLTGKPFVIPVTENARRKA
jgi:iron complex transport system ATP-binding protein